MSSGIKSLKLKVIKNIENKLYCISDDILEKCYILKFRKENVKYNFDQIGCECFLDIIENDNGVESNDLMPIKSNDLIIELKVWNSSSKDNKLCVIYEKNPITNIVSISNEAFYISFWGPDAMMPKGYYYLNSVG